MSNVTAIVVGVITGFALAMARDIYRHFKADPDLDGLVPPIIEPGPWFSYYAEDWAALQGEPITSAIIAVDGRFVWATDTPEWDREWFAVEMGWEFPDEWVPYSSLPGQVRL